jgi:hypothetical protein
MPLIQEQLCANAADVTRSSDDQNFHRRKWDARGWCVKGEGRRRHPSGMADAD